MFVVIIPEEAEYVKSAGLAGHVWRKFQMASEGVNFRRTKCLARGN